MWRVAGGAVLLAGFAGLGHAGGWVEGFLRDLLPAFGVLLLGRWLYRRFAEPRRELPAGLNRAERRREENLGKR